LAKFGHSEKIVPRLNYVTSAFWSFCHIFWLFKTFVPEWNFS
jgi:hypothetical protein